MNIEELSGGNAMSEKKYSLSEERLNEWLRLERNNPAMLREVAAAEHEATLNGPEVAEKMRQAGAAERDEMRRQGWMAPEMAVCSSTCLFWTGTGACELVKDNDLLPRPRTSWDEPKAE